MKSVNEAKAAFGAVSIKDPGITMRILKLEKAFQSMVEDIYDLVPENADRTAGARLLLQAKWTFVQAVTHAEAPPQEKKNAKSKNAEA